MARKLADEEWEALLLNQGRDDATTDDEEKEKEDGNGM